MSTECLKLPFWIDSDHVFRFLALSNRRVILPKFSQDEAELHASISMLSLSFPATEKFFSISSGHDLLTPKILGCANLRAKSYSLMTDVQYMKCQFNPFSRQRYNCWTERVCMSRSRHGESKTLGKALEPSLIEVRCAIGSKLYSEFGFPKERSQQVRCQSARSVLRTRKEERAILSGIPRVVRGRLLFSRPVEGVPLSATDCQYGSSYEELQRVGSKKHGVTPLLEHGAEKLLHVSRFAPYSSENRLASKVEGVSENPQSSVSPS